MRFLTISLALVAALAFTACASKTSSNSTTTSSDTSAAATATPADSAATTAAQPASGGSDMPSYPGATTQASGSGSNMGTTASGTVLTTDDSFDKVYTWYRQHMPAGSEKSHMTAPVQSAVFIVGDPSSGQKSVTITVQGTKTMI